VNVKRELLAAMMVALLSGPAGTQEGIWAKVTVDCGRWIEARTAGRASSLEAYLLGLLDGISFGAWVEFWKAGGIDTSKEQVFLWMDNYCRENPLSDVVPGAFTLFEERLGYPLRPVRRDAPQGE
jgi:hypothetical protein